MVLFYEIHILKENQRHASMNNRDKIHKWVNIYYIITNMLYE